MTNVKKNKKEYLGCLAAALAIFIASPIDDLIIASICGTALFGFGTIGFYLLLAVTTTFSVLMWKKHSLIKASFGKFWLKINQRRHMCKIKLSMLLFKGDEHLFSEN